MFKKYAKNYNNILKADLILIAVFVKLPAEYREFYSAGLPSFAALRIRHVAAKCICSAALSRFYVPHTHTHTLLCTHTRTFIRAPVKLSLLLPACPTLRMRNFV